MPINVTRGRAWVVRVLRFGEVSRYFKPRDERIYLVVRVGHITIRECVSVARSDGVIVVARR